MASESDAAPPAALAANGNDKPGPADVVLPMSGIVKCAKQGLGNMHLSAEAKQAIHDAALVFISFVSTMSHERTKARSRKTVSAEDVIAELKSLGFMEMATSLANSVLDFRNRKSKKRSRDAEPGSATAAVAAPAAGTEPAQRPAPGDDAAPAPAAKRSATADLAGMWGIKTGSAAAVDAEAEAEAEASSQPASVPASAGGDSDDDDEAAASQEQLAEMAAAFSVDES